MSIAAIDYESNVPAPARKRVADKAPLAFAPKKKELNYYDFGPVLSFNAVYNFIIGGRGLGKTYGAKKYAINRWLKKKEKFIYVRRHETEVKNLDTWFADIQHEWENVWDFRANGRKFEVSPASERDMKKRQWEVIGYCIPLSTAQKVKSVPFPDVTTIIFDEFIIEKGNVHYLANEFTAFNNFYNTVDRWDDRVKVLFLANSVSIANPYFTALKILPTDDENEFLRDPEPEKFWIAHFPEAAEFTNQVFQTRFGKFIEGTEYADYAVGNQFADNHQGLIALKNERAKHMFNLETGMGTMSVWYDVLEDRYYVMRDRIPTGQLTLTLLPDLMTEDKLLLTENMPMFKKLKQSYGSKKLRFDNAGTRNIFVLEIKP